MKKAVAFLVVGAFVATAASSAAAEPFVLEPIGTSTLFTPGEGSATTLVWSLKVGKPEFSETQAVLTVRGPVTDIITPLRGGWLRSAYDGLGSKDQVRVDLRRGGDELLPVVLRGIRPLLARLISEIAVYPSGIRVNFRSGVSETEIRSAAGQSGMQIAVRE